MFGAGLRAPEVSTPECLTEVVTVTGVAGEMDMVRVHTNHIPLQKVSRARRRPWLQRSLYSQSTRRSRATFGLALVRQESLTFTESVGQAFLPDSPSGTTAVCTRSIGGRVRQESLTYNSPLSRNAQHPASCRTLVLLANPVGIVRTTTAIPRVADRGERRLGCSRRTG
jgi:hypothetical protein